MDYSQRHVVILEEYLKVMQQKKKDREVANQIKEN
jgi:hypothetical protein